MTKSNPSRRIRRIMDVWIKRLGLEKWDLSFELSTDGAVGDASDGLAAVGECQAWWEYERATIRFDEDYATICDDGALERLIVHELMHVVLNELRDGQTKHKQEERTAVVLTRAFMKAKAA